MPPYLFILCTSTPHAHRHHVQPPKEAAQTEICGETCGMPVYMC